MLQVSDKIQSGAKADIRTISTGVKMSFDKAFNSSITFFTIGSSLIGGGDFIPGTNSVVQQWDKYVYGDYSDRLISIEWTRQTDPISAITQAMADITLNNYDDYFTPGAGSPISNYILPYRPIRLFAGFNGDTIPVFIGVTEKMPVIDQKKKTVTFHCIDFMYSLLNTPLNQVSMYVNLSVSDILNSLFQIAGISASQFQISGSSTFIPFAFFDIGTKLIDAVQKLIQADLGRIYMDENGVIQYKSRQTYSNTPVYYFDEYTNVIDKQDKTQDDIINVVEISGNVRTVQPKQEYWSSPTSTLIPANSSKDIWANFQDPVTTVDIPVYVDSATTSSFSVIDTNGNVDSTHVTLTAHSQFATSYKITFTNSSSIDLYVNTLTLYATPAVQTQPIYIRNQDDNSVNTYDERLLSIQNDFFQDSSTVDSFEKIILADFANPTGVTQLTVKGTPALQIDDTIFVNIYGRSGYYKILKIDNRITQPARYTQTLSLKSFTSRSYFTIGQSLIGNIDQIRP